MKVNFNNQIPNHNYDEIYNLTEISTNGPSHNGIFQNSHNHFNHTGVPDCYNSVYLHSQEIKPYFNTHFNEKGQNSVAGYKGSVWIKQLVIDFDIEEEKRQEDLLQLKEDIKRFLLYLQQVYEVELSHLQYRFSGCKGFHIIIPAILFGGFDASETLPDQIRNIVIKLTEGWRIDTSIYNHISYIRIPNTKNSKSNLFAIPLTKDELFRLTIDEIKELAKQPRTVDFIDPKELLPNTELVKLKDEIVGKKIISTSYKEYRHQDTDEDDEWMGVEMGQRNTALASVIGYLISRRVAYSRIRLIGKWWNQHCTPPEDEKIVLQHINSLIKDFSVSEESFWRIDKGKVTFSYLGFKQFLENEGFAKIYLENDYIFIQVQNQVVHEVSLPQIKDYVITYISEITSPHRDQILEELLSKTSSLLGEKMIECIKTISEDFNKDQKETAHFYFKNKTVEISREMGIRILAYSATSKMIWESEIIKKDILITDEKSDFEKFIFNIAGNDDVRFKSVQSAIGYLLHSYKDSSKAKVIILCDEKVTDFPDGRTGKSILGKALSQLRPTVRIDGKNFDFSSRFTFQQINLDTRLLEFNDVRKDFDFERLFSVVTDDMTIENKGQKPFTIRFDRSPKILVSTNYTIKGSGSSFTDRMFELEFTNFYNENHKPIDDFGKRFFDEWDEDEWNRFYNFMFKCIQVYLTEGLISKTTSSLITRKIIDSTCREFYEFMEEDNFLEEHLKREAFYEFQKRYPDYLQLKQHTFTKWLKLYCTYKGYQLEELKSGGKYYFKIVQ